MTDPSHPRGLSSRTVPPTQSPLGVDLAWAVTIGCLTVCTGLSLALEKVLDASSLAMIFLCGIALVAYRCSRAHALATIAGSIFIYDLIFVEPRWSLKPTEPRYWLAFAVMAVVGWVISHLAAMMREHAQLADARAQRTSCLSQFVSALNVARSEAEVAAALRAALHESLNLKGDVIPAAVEPQGLMPLVSNGQTLAHLKIEGDRGSQLPQEDQALLQAMVNQAALAMQRARFEMKSQEAAIEAERERLRSTLLAGVSHDFRTPLTTIMGCATALLEQSDAIQEADRTVLIQDMLSEAQRLHRLSSNLLDLSRLDEGAITLQPEWCPAEDIVEEALRPFRSATASGQIQVGVSPEAVVWCDPLLVHQVLVNLVDNALRHSPRGVPIDITIDVGTADWRLSVTDQGDGVAPGDELAVFQKFYRSADDKESTGKGLGLAICAAVLKLHGGRIFVTNSPGAAFTAIFPQPATPALETGGIA